MERYICDDCNSQKYPDKYPDVHFDEVEKEYILDRTREIGGKVLELAEIYQYLADEETLSHEEVEARLLNKLLEDSPYWTKSLDGKWIVNPIDHKAEYLG